MKGIEGKISTLSVLYLSLSHTHTKILITVERKNKTLDERRKKIT